MVSALGRLRSGGAERLWKARCIAAGVGRDRARIRVYSGGRQDWIGGPATKLNRLIEFFPDEPHSFNIIYSVGATVPAAHCRWAKRRGVKIVCHINSMNHGAYAPDFEERNRSAAEVFSIADHLVFGSIHAREAARKYLGETKTPHTIIYNAVDIDRFHPRLPEKGSGPTVLIMGVHYLSHSAERLLPLLRAMPMVARKHQNARLLVAGPLAELGDPTDRGPSALAPLLREVNLDRIEFLGSYRQDEAPSICNRAEVLVHLKHMDWTPNTVIEGMACGLPVVHPGNGGLPELVDEAGVSLDLPDDWDKVHTADPGRLAEKIIEAYERRDELGRSARQRAVEMFDLRKWAEAHRRIFQNLLAGA